MAIKEVSLFKTKTLKSLDKSTFKGGNPELGGGVPPVVADEEEASAIEDRSRQAGEVMDMFNSGNFLLMLILGGSMQQLWGMIRAIQMISLSALVNVAYPINLFIFLQVCIIFANMDILKSEDFYADNLVFKSTDAVNESFAFFGIGDKNFILNSGSYFMI
jgi:hypothetical protein